MPSLRESPSILIAGNWNPAIIQPTWLAKNLFGAENREECPVVMEFSPTPGMPPRFEIEGIKFVPTPGNLTILCPDESKELLVKGQDLAITLLETLVHTPIIAFGQNFKYLEENPSPKLLADFGNLEPINTFLGEYESELSKKILHSIKLENCVLNYSRNLIIDSNQVELDFNYHYNVTGAPDASGKLGNSFITNLGIAQQILANYSEE